MDYNHWSRAAWLSLLLALGGRRCRERPIERNILRVGTPVERHRCSGPGVNLLRTERHAARRCALALVPFRCDRPDAAHPGLYSAGVRLKPADALSRALPATRIRRKRTRLGSAGPRELHPR